MFFVCVNAAYAYFTASALKSAGSGTSVIKIEMIDGTAEVNSVSGHTKIMPGDTLKVSSRIQNTGSAGVYTIILFKLKITKQDGSIDTSTRKFYTIDNNSLKEIKGSENNFSYNAFIIEPNETTQMFGVDYTFGFNKYNNSYKNAVVEYELSASAVQKGGLETNVVATNYLMSDFKSGISQLAGVSTQASEPTSTNPSQIKSVGDKTKNLFNAKAIKSSSIKVSNDGQTITMPVVTSGNGHISSSTTLAELCPDLKIGDTVYLSFVKNTSTNPMI